LPRIQSGIESLFEIRHSLHAGGSPPNIRWLALYDVIRHFLPKPGKSYLYKEDKNPEQESFFLLYQALTSSL
jgi:hypothetical protein